MEISRVMNIYPGRFMVAAVVFFFIVPQYVNLIWLRNCVRMWYVTKVRSINRRAKQKIKGSVIVTANISLDTNGEMTNYVGQDIFLRYLLD
jgi:hypothetical protein